ncbi:NAD(P)H-binding protein [Streptomyces sp. So13.3]|uniref:NmrA family NAD(P)-binding protein n=1 Tax=unclassified Streptomyces TaxID=2593676 RepID=UPI0011068864|nr:MULTISPECIES: NAD(P)H-binding protein [unclassified Streptomyces]MCZ4095371.1 NAD(P)H-binding protein [Streptomyces sp. H39-C1]QNA71087.1 NAD(P)H-binding protein [Streptomyces sp. So13.3]
MIIVTGATGQLGRQIVERLLTRVPAARIGVSVRDPQKAQTFADQGVRVRHGSFTDADSLAHAFEGATQVLIVSVDKMGEEAVRQHRAAIDGAVAAGARRILYTSHMGAGAGSQFQPCRDHAATEEALRASGVPFTSLRNGFYTANALQFLGQALESGRVELPADGPVSWTAHADLADAAAAILADEGCFDGPTPPLTAAQALTFDDIAGIATDGTGRTFTRITATDDQFREQLSGHGVPAEAADQLLGVFTASRAGEFAAVDPTLATLLGREPVALSTVLHEQLAATAR